MHTYRTFQVWCWGNGGSLAMGVWCWPCWVCSCFIWILDPKTTARKSWTLQTPALTTTARVPSRNSIVAELGVKEDRQRQFLSVHLCWPLFTVIVVFAEMFEWWLLSAWENELLSNHESVAVVGKTHKNLLHKHFVPYLTGELWGDGQSLYYKERKTKARAYKKEPRSILP